MHRLRHRRGLRNPRESARLVEGQVIGGFSNGLGNALYEENTYDELKASRPPRRLADYTAPTAPSMPGRQAGIHRDARRRLRDVRHQG